MTADPRDAHPLAAARRLRIGLVLERFDATAGGLESWTCQFASALVARHHEVHVVATAFAPTDLPIIRHSAPSDASPWRLAQGIERVVAGLPVDILHDMGFGWSAHVIQPHAGSRMLNIERDLASIRLAPRIRYRLSPQFRAWRRALAATELRQMSSPACVIAISELVGRDLRDRYDLPSDRVVVVPNGVDTERFSSVARDRSRMSMRRALGIGDDVVFLVVAHNFRLKGVDAALGAFARLVPMHPAIRLIVAGNGLIDAYRQRAARLGIEARVTFPGRVAEMERLYAAADVLLHPTFHDAGSLVTLEALAMGLPVVTTRANGAADRLRSGREGFIIDRPGSEAALAEAMTALLDPARRAEFGAAAARLAPALGFDANVAGILDVYDRVLASAAPPA